MGKYKASLKELLEQPIQLYKSGIVQGVSLTGKDNGAYDLIREHLLKEGVPVREEATKGYYDLDLRNFEITNPSQ